MLLHPQVLLPAHCYHAVHSAHKSLRLPPEMAQEVSCRSLKRSRSSHSLNSYNAEESQLLFPIRLDHQFPSHFRMPLCRRLHLVTSLTRCPRRRLFNRTPFRVMWPSRRFSMVPLPYHWMLLRRRPHPALRLSMSLRRWVLAQLPRFLLIRLCRFLHIVLYYLTLPHNSTSLEFLIGWIYSDQPLDRRHPFCQSPPSILGAHVAPLPPPGLEQPTPPPVISTQPQSLTNVSSSHCPTLQPTASTTHVGTHPVRPAGAKRSASTAHAGNHNSNGPCPRAEVAPFPKPNAVVLPMLNFGHSKTCGPSPVATADSDIMHHQFRLSLLQWNPGPARRNPTNVVSAACGKFHAVILQEASDHVPHISDYFRAYTDNTDLAILLNKDTFEPDPFVTSFKVDSTSKNTWVMVLLIVRAMLRRPSLSGSPTVTFCSAHIHNVVAKKRDASTELLQFLHSKMLEYNVDFIGGDFNMSAFSTVSDVFSDPEFSAPGHSCLWGLGALDEQYRECTGFLIMPKRPYEWRVDSHGCYKIDNSALGLGPRDQSAHLPVFLHLRNTNILDPIALCEVSRLSKEDLNANATKNVGRDKVLVRALRFAFSLCLCATRCLLSPNVRSCWFYGAKTTTRRRTLL